MALEIAAPPEDPDRELATLNTLKPLFDGIWRGAQTAGWKPWEIAAAFMDYGASQTVLAGLSDDDAAQVMAQSIALRDQLINGF